MVPRVFQSACLSVYPALIFFVSGVAPGVAAEQEDVYFSSLERVARVSGLTEGPALNARGELFFSAVKENRIYRLSPEGALSVFYEGAKEPYGLAFDRTGRLWVCESAARRVIRIAPGGQAEAMAERDEQGKPLRSPNDLCVLDDGTVYFTDPGWGQKPEGVYRIGPAGGLSRLTGDISLPNGIEVSPDGKRLYVASSGENRVVVWRLENGLPVSGPELFAEVPAPDGIAVDSGGRVFVAQFGHGRVLAFDASGVKVGALDLPEKGVTNGVFSREDPSLLWVTAGRSVYRVRTK